MLNLLKTFFGSFILILVLIGCEENTVSPSADELTTITLAKNPNIDAFDMNDRFGEPPSGAKGNGIVKVIDGQMNLTIHARGLETGHPYEVHVAIGGKDVDCSVFAVDHVHIFPVTSDSRGKFTFKIVGLNLNLDPGEYRIDYVVVHGDGSHGGFVLACEPQSCVTI